MRKYSLNAGSTERIQFGIELAAGLRAQPETRKLADPVEEVNDRLEAAKHVRMSKCRPVLRAHATLRVVQQETDRQIRMFARAVELAEGGRRGPLFAELFPQGVTPVVAPRGARQLEPTVELVGRLERSLTPGADGLRAPWLRRLRRQANALRACVETLAAATVAYSAAFASETAVRLEHRRVVDCTGGQVRATFPNDRPRQDAVFPRKAASRQALAGTEDKPPPEKTDEAPPGSD